MRANDQLPESTYALIVLKSGCSTTRVRPRFAYPGNDGTGRQLATVLYEGRGYDRVMLNTYQALNYLRLGQPDAAMVELRQASDEQDAELIRNARRSPPHASRLGGISQIFYAHKTMPARAQLDRLQPSLNMDYGAFANPFRFPHALACGASRMTRENAIVSLRRIHDTLGGPEFIADEIELVDGVLSGNKHPDLTYVIFETGVARCGEGSVSTSRCSTGICRMLLRISRLENRGHPLTCAVAIGETRWTPPDLRHGRCDRA